MTAMQITAIKTAYSTDVGPSSDLENSFIFLKKLHIEERSFL